MSAGRVHVVGAGMAGLAAAIRLLRAGRRVEVHEAAIQAGGRCRSYYDPALGREIDNGNHLILSGNRAIHAYLGWIGASEALTGPARAEFPFLDLRTGERWTVRPGRGRFPWWVLSSKRRIPGSRPREYLSALKLPFVPQEATVSRCLSTEGRLYERFWEPLTVAVLNAAPEEAAAGLLWPVLKETFGRGEAACRPQFAREGLGKCFVDPALTMLAAAGDSIRFRHRLQEIDFDDDRAKALRFGQGEIVPLDQSDTLILAVPPAATGSLVRGIETPEGSRAIVNGHFRLDRRFECASMLGLVGGLIQWLFVRHDVASVTISAARALADQASDEIARRMWQDVARALRLDEMPLPPYRVVKEKRATFAQTPSNMRRRPPARTRWRNMFLAGDWTDTGLPATLEGSVRSGIRAAEALLADAAMT